MTPRQSLESLFAAWRDGDALRSGAHFALEGSYREARGEPIVGREAIVAHFTRFFRDGPPWRFEVEDVLVDGLRAAVSYRFAVRQADGTWRERPGAAIVMFADGTIAQWREYEG